MAINTGPSYGGQGSSRGNAMRRQNTMSGRVGGAKPMGGGFKSTPNMGGPMGPSGAPNVGAPVFGASVMPGMEGTSDTPMMPQGGGGFASRFRDMVPGGGFTGGMNRGMGPSLSAIDSVGPGAAPDQPAMPPPQGPVARRPGGIRPPFANGGFGFGFNGAAPFGNMGKMKSASMGYNPINTGPSGY